MTKILTNALKEGGVLSHHGYAISFLYCRRNRRSAYTWLHHFVIHGAIRKGIIDHIDRNKLNCCKSNLRFANASINSLNRDKRPDNRSGYRGVCWDKSKGKYMSYLTLNGHRHYLGRYKTKLEAAVVYDDAAMVLHGELAALNFPLYGA